jgi:predicted metal-dependent peptidase
MWGGSCRPIYTIVQIWEIPMDADTKIARARTRLVLDNPFFGSLALGLDLHRDDTQPTMCTNGAFIKWNGDFVDNHTDKEVVGVLAHEVLHVAFKHMLRRGDRDHKRWNIACDHAINHILLDSGFELPEGGLWDDQYKGMTAEKIYSQLPDDAGDNEDGCPWGEVTDATNGDGDALSTSEAKQMEASIDQKVMLAASAGEAIGKLPAAIKELVEEMRRSKVDWRDVFARFIGGDQPDDYTWRRPQKRMWYQHGIYMPAVDKIGVGDVVVAVDTSGSVSTIELQQFLGELNNITEDHKPNSVTVITCDSIVRTVNRYEQGEIIDKIECTGRGGTRVEPVFKYIEENDIPVDNMVYLSDMGIFDFPETAPEYPVLWVSTDERYGDAPFGQTTRIDPAA